MADGKRLRASLPREAHGVWDPAAVGRDPIAILEDSNEGRLNALIPIRYGRMLRSPFTFLRGSSALMAADLATTPSTGLQVQACGDCHLLNFGLFATPERNLVFDLNDFDETHPAPWEWDIKRLAASFVVAGRDNDLKDKQSRQAALACVRSYRQNLRRFSQMSPLEVWYLRLDMEDIIAAAPNEEARARRKALAAKARQRITENVFPRIATIVGGRPRFVDQPPVLYHASAPDLEERVLEGLEDYRESLSHERRVLLDRYQFVDYALKVVGIGSVGTRCHVALLYSEENHPLILQIKEARRSVLEPYTQPCTYGNQGQRVVMGQRLIQSSSDIFLGWVRGRHGYEFFVRQLRDMKLSVPIEGLTGAELAHYAADCGWTLARAHARSGDSATISGYLGKSAAFDEAIADFAVAYADQTERDHAALAEAVEQGRIEALLEEEL
ncbi:MAG: DUF2252 domain-containing protein [Prochlorococcaceae cyanobacterium]